LLVQRSSTNRYSTFSPH